jgi:hypothetical protein
VSAQSGQQGSHSFQQDLLAGFRAVDEPAGQWAAHGVGEFDAGGGSHFPGDLTSLRRSRHSRRQVVRRHDRPRPPRSTPETSHGSWGTYGGGRLIAAQLVPGLFCDGFAVRLDGYRALDRLTRMYGPATRAHAAARALRPGTVLAAGQVP